ncbi:acetyltransferase [Bifidobacterium scaligerum]|uniref:Acetyltransferase n=1 Tax=Bifidobacterium scaligerum TaxID=2052656 RepID=A0A2M9HTM5_9BIFI|nr:acetyltransferase [Bifidobacterium scaligerum]
MSASVVGPTSRTASIASPARTAPAVRRPIHWQGIDGLRALAILGVIAFHTRPSLLQGGFIGVTLFFVITGFLATRSVMNAVDTTGTFNYGRYLLRRITRIWPVLLSTIAIVPWLAWLFAPSLLIKIVTDALPSALFASNWVYIFRKVPYFQAAGLPSPLTHLWFLSVTMQFYVVWPLAMWALARITRSKWIRSLVVVIVMLSSTTAMYLLFDPSSTSRVYYGTDTRLAELAAGGLLAIWMASSNTTQHHDVSAGFGRSRIPVIVRNLGGGLALAAILASFWLANGYVAYMYQGGYLIAAVVCLAALACATDDRSLWPKILGCAPLRYIGSRSFSLYVIHYPLLQFMNPATRTQPLPWWGWLVEAAIILVASELFYRLVEAVRAPMLLSRSRHAVAVQIPRTGLRPGAWMLSAVAVVTVIVLTWAPVDWQGIAQSRAVQLRPELANTARPVKPRHPSPSTAPGNNAPSSSSTDGDQSHAQPAVPSITPIAEKVPNNLDITRYTYDPATESCSADMMMIGDSVTSGTSDAIQAAFPNAFIDGHPNRQLSQATDVLQQDVASGHTGSVMVFGLGTNGVIDSEEQVQQLIDQTDGKPTYFITIRMPYPWQENNNNTMLRKAASKNPNVGIIDWHAYSEGHPEFLNDDGIHPTMTGAYAYATMIRQAVCGQ